VFSVSLFEKTTTITKKPVFLASFTAANALLSMIFPVKWEKWLKSQKNGEF